MSTVTAVLLGLAALGVLESWVLIPAAVLLGGGAIAWNSVGMLAVMDFSPPSLVGKGTGVVLLGFLLGMASGAPLMGLSVDTLGSYVPGWLASAGLLTAGAVIAGRIPGSGTLAES
jgi:MFS family permease